MPVDRRERLREQAHRLTGLDFARVEDPCDQRVVRVYFLTDPASLEPPFGVDEPAAIAIESTRAGDPAVPLDPSAPPRWGVDPDVGRAFLELTVQRAPTSFAPHRVRVDDPRVDPFFAEVELDFKRGCLDGDCLEDDADDCPAGPVDEPLLDHLARDFVSLRGAMLDLLAQRHPEWAHETEADVGVMLVELLAAVGDELSYVQDRVAREAFLHTATQRRSLQRLVRLVDFEVHDGRLAETWLSLTVGGADALVSLPRQGPGGAVAWARSASEPPIPFEVADVEGVAQVVSAAWNLGRLVPYWGEDPRRRVARCGARELWVRAPIAHAAFLSGRHLLLVDGETGRAHRARVEALVPGPDGGVEHDDPLLGERYYRLRLAAGDALPFALDLSQAQVGANLVRAVAGRTHEAVFVVGAEPDAWVEPTVAREGAVHGLGVDDVGLAGVLARQDGLDSARRRPAIHRFTLPGSDTDPLGWYGQRLRDTVPALELRELRDEVALGAEVRAIRDTELGAAWIYRPTLLDSAEGARDFTLEAGTWRRVVGYPLATAELARARERAEGRSPARHELVHRDYARGAGVTIRFGDGTFGAAPPLGKRFVARWRSSPGEAANVPAGAIVALEVLGLGHARTMPEVIRAVTNPFPVVEGVDGESLTDVRLLAPEAWRERLFASWPGDYAEQAERLPFVQRAHADVRWTGSWSAVRVSVDPRESDHGWWDGAPSADEHAEFDLELRGRLDAVRQAGREVLVRRPRTWVLDLVLRVCVDEGAHAEVVREAIRRALVGPHLRTEPLPFFHPDRFTFGTPLDRAALEHTVHAVAGVRSVLGAELAVRGVRRATPFTELRYPTDVPPDVVLRLDGARGRPEHGTLTIRTEGGA
ncbi:MAG: hypothetical protein KF901_27960 [Myxococcales bacterium]|nr:hypothetical protein [Myxococcales bacterium]